MAVTQRKDGTWAVVYRVEGKQRWEYCGKGIEGERKAKARNHELKETGRLGKYNRQAEQVSSPLFSALAEAYLKAKAVELPKVSIDNMLYKFSGVILPAIGDIQATRLTPDRIRTYIRKRMQTPITKRVGPSGIRRVPVTNPDGSQKMTSKSTIHRELSDIQAIMNWAVAERYILTNPLQNFKKPARDDAIILPPTPGETRRMLAHAADHLRRALIISFYTGLRPGVAELFGIVWADINLDDGVIHIISAKKGGARDRMIPLHPEFQQMLEQWHAQDHIVDATTTPVIMWNGKPIKSIKKSFSAAKRRAGITRRIRPYDFRHAFATAMLKTVGI